MDCRTAIVVGGTRAQVGCCAGPKLRVETVPCAPCRPYGGKLTNAIGVIKNEGGSGEAVVTDATIESDIVRLFDRGMSPDDGKRRACDRLEPRNQRAS